MNNYQNFKNALITEKETKFEALKLEVNTLKDDIEKFIDKALNCTSSLSERDYNISF